MSKKLLIAVACAMLSGPSGAQAADAREVLASFHAALAAGDKAMAIDFMAPEVAIYESGHVEGSRTEYAKSITWART